MTPAHSTADTSSSLAIAERVILEHYVQKTNENEVEDEIRKRVEDAKTVESFFRTQQDDGVRILSKTTLLMFIASNE